MSKITESARNEDCQIRIPGVCNFNPATVVWCHAGGSAAGKGLGMKVPDILGAYGCSKCHDAVDNRSWATTWNGYSKEQIRLMFWEGHARSVIILMNKGLIK
ncbi:MAG: nuclease domain-containing protein [Bellilinea sp.]